MTFWPSASDNALFPLVCCRHQQQEARHQHRYRVRHPRVCGCVAGRRRAQALFHASPPEAPQVLVPVVHVDVHVLPLLRGTTTGRHVNAVD